MPVNNPFALTAGIQYVDGTASTATSFTGTVAMSFNASNNIVGLRSDSSDNLLVNVAAFSGTVSTVGTLTHNAAVPAANNIGALVAVASSAAPTYNAGDQVLLSTDLAGNLRVGITGSVVAANNIEQWNSVNLGSPTAYGTAPGAVNVIGVNAFVTNTVTVSGTVAVTQSTSPWVVSLASTTITGTVAVTQSTSPWVVSLTSTTITGTVAVTQSTSPWDTSDQADVTAGTTTAPTKILIVGGKTDDATAEYQPLPLAAGGTAIITQGFQPTGTTGTITTATSTVVLTSANGINVVTVTVSGTYAGVTFVIEGFDGTNWYGVNAQNNQTGQVMIGGIAPGTNTLASYDVTVGGYTEVRVRATAYTSGTATINMLAQASSYEAVPAAVINGIYSTTQPTPASGTANPAQIDQSGNLLGFPGVQVITGAAWATATAVNTVQYPTGTTTVGAPLGGQAVIVQLDMTTTLTAGAVTFQGTYDGTNWVTIPVAQVLNPQTYQPLTNPYTFVASTNTPFLILLQGFQQIRASLSTAITGTGSVTPHWAILAQSPVQVITSVVSTSGGTNVATGSIGATKTAIKTTGGAVYGWYFYNSNTTVAYVQFFNVASAGVTLGTTAPTMSLGIPAAAGANVVFDAGITFNTAITVAITTTRAGATGPTNTVDYNIFYL